MYDRVPDGRVHQPAHYRYRRGAKRPVFRAYNRVYVRNSRNISVKRRFFPFQGFDQRFVDLFAHTCLSYASGTDQSYRALGNDSIRNKLRHFIRRSLYTDFAVIRRDIQ